MTTEHENQVETTGETVGEAKWAALRELEKLYPGLDKSAVRFQVLSEGERGLLGVGFTPARVVATIDAETVEEAPGPEGEAPTLVRELLERITSSLGLRCRIDLAEENGTIVASCAGVDLGRLIGKHGHTIDAIQYVVNAIVSRRLGEERRPVVVDAAGYRARRRTALTSLAQRCARRALETGEPVHLEPMSAVERKVVHECLKDESGVETRSEGTEPQRYVIISPSQLG
jgi:spoIIIJ-associated protein